MARFSLVYSQDQTIRDLKSVQLTPAQPYREPVFQMVDGEFERRDGKLVPIVRVECVIELDLDSADEFRRLIEEFTGLTLGAR